MQEVKDQAGNLVSLPGPASRIICLVPSVTELLYDLGLDKEVVGITKFCVHPNEWFRTKTRIGGTKNVDIEKARSLQPDLIIAGKEENIKEQVEALALFCPVYVSDVKTLQDAIVMILDLGELTRKQEPATLLSQKVLNGFDRLVKLDPPVKCCYLIWQRPYMVAGGDTFINDMLRRCGFENVFSSSDRYPAITAENILESGCELVLLSSEPFPFSKKHIHQLGIELEVLRPGSRIPRLKLVDGEMFSWYGSRLLHAPACFYELQMFAIGQAGNFNQ